MSVSEVSV